MKHLSYMQFKNIFGDLGVTAWVKYNWLSNGLPDGTYNGITKITLDGTGFSYHSSGVIYKQFPFVPTINNNTPYPFGFADVPIVGAEYERTIQGLHISFHTNGNIDVCFSNKTSRSEIENALKKNPITVYFYNKNEWEGVIVSQLDSFQAATGFGYVGIGVSSKEIHETSGTFTSLLPQNQDTFLFNAKDKSMASSTSTSANMLMFMSKSSTSAEDFKNKFLPLSVVYKK